jgi:hypothetical protein
MAHCIGIQQRRDEGHAPSLAFGVFSSDRWYNYTRERRRFRSPVSSTVEVPGSSRSIHERRLIALWAAPARRPYHSATVRRVLKRESRLRRQPLSTAVPTSSSPLREHGGMWLINVGARCDWSHLAPKEASSACGGGQGMQYSLGAKAKLLYRRVW